MNIGPRSLGSAWLTGIAILIAVLGVSACGGGSAGSETQNTTTTPTPSSNTDTTLPGVTITSPSSNTTVSTSTITLSGTASDNVGVVQVTWRNDSTSASGTASGLTSWSVTNIPLQSGNNTLTVTARDAAGNLANASRTVTYNPPPPPPTPDTTAPSVQITTPTGNVTVTSNSITLSGTASDNIGVTQVTWRNDSTSASGTASGLTSWSVTNIPLQSGNNTLTVTARDAAGNQSSASRNVTYSPLVTSNVKLTWESPTTNTDQSCLTNLSGYIVSYGNSPGVYTMQETIPVSTLSCANTATTTACGVIQSCTYTVRGLSRGPWYFSVSAYTPDLVISEPSNEASLTLN